MVQGYHAADWAVEPATCGGVLREDVVQRQAEEETQEHAGEIPPGAGQRQEGSQQELRRTEPDAKGSQRMGRVTEGERAGENQRKKGTKIPLQDKIDLAAKRVKTSINSQWLKLWHLAL